MAITDISLTSGMRSNLLALQGTAAALTQTQERLSSGKKVNSALDNPTNFFSAQSHLQRAADLGDRRDAMAEGIQTVKAADSGIKAITSLIQAAKGLASSALGTTDLDARKSYQEQFNTLRTQIDDLANDSGYKGTNLLNSAKLTVQFNERTDASTLDIQGFDASTKATGLSILTPGAGVAATAAATDAGGALKVASDTLTAVKNSYDAAGLAQEALQAAGLAITTNGPKTGTMQADAAVAQAAALASRTAALAAGDAIQTALGGGPGADAKLFFTDAAAALGTAAAYLATIASGASTPGAPDTAAATAAGTTAANVLNGYNVVTTTHAATATSAASDAAAAAPLAVAAGDKNVGAALTSSVVDLATAASALTGASGMLFSAYNEAKGTGLTNAAASAASASSEVIGSAALWNDADASIGAAAISASSKALDGALATLRTQSSALASNMSVITTRQEFTSTMISTLTTGADNLTLADMNQEGANMLMLQTRQSLSTTALSLSSQAAQSILKLF